MIPQDIALLDKTEITARTDLGEITLVIGKTQNGYTCALWSGDKLLGSNKFGSAANVITKAASIGPLLVMAKQHLQATADKYPSGLAIVVRVDHKGKTHEIPGRIPLDAGQLAQFGSLIGWVRKVNDIVQGGSR
jgi:hypothetical protein